MHWGLYLLALVGVYLVQTTLLRHFAPEWIDLLLALALLLGLTLPAPEARLAGWGAGLMVDIGTDGPLGVHALFFGAAVFLLTYLRELVNRELWWVRWLAGVLVAWPAQLLVFIYERVYEGAARSVGGILLQSLLTAIVAALLATLLLEIPRLGARRRYSFERW